MNLGTQRIITAKLKAARLPDGNLEPGYSLAGRYLIVGTLGAGGMGSVYQARDMHFPNVTKLVAVKEMINLAPDPALRDMVIHNFEREANLLATLNHPAIPEIYDYFSAPERSYLVMEYINGKDLEAILNETKGFLPAAQVVEWAIQLCDVLTYLHTHKPPIVFRDVKPSNVMIDHHGHVRLIDFGIARGFEAGQKGTMIGTEGYSPPEQYRGEASPSGDLYALGATLHHLLSKRDPRLEPPFSFSERPLRKLNPEVSAELDAVINTALAYNPEDRFQSAQAMRAALQVLGAAHAQARPEAALSAGARAAAGQIVPLWVFACEDEVRSSPLVAEGMLFVGSYDNNLYALRAADGKLVWKFATDGGLAASPVYASGNVYIGSEDRRLYAVSVRSGRIQWSYFAEGPIRCSARIRHDHIFFGSDDAHLHAVALASGRLAWRAEAAAPVRSTPAIAEERVFFGCESGDFYCLDFSGALKWRFKAKRGITSAPAVHDGLVYFGSADWTVYALESSTGFPIWRYRTRRAVISSPLLESGVLYVGSADNAVYALEARAGKEIWRYETEGQVNSSPVLHGNAIYVGSVDGHVYSLDAATGQLRWRFKTDGPIVSTPWAAEDVVYIASTDHKVYALAA